jgi:uncharacterized protein
MENDLYHTVNSQIVNLKKLVKIFYIIKPLLPRGIQLVIRRFIASRKLKKYSTIWPIDSRAGQCPPQWPGWPRGKKFALALMHDVDTQKGHDNCHKLMDLEESLGIRSVINIVPERYTISSELLKEIKRRGFGLGVHGLNHDGKLFLSQDIFIKNAQKINEYLHKWGSRGFSSPSMHHKLEWMHHLDIDYSVSTFDTDPFEPQPDAVCTIFPFVVENDSSHKSFVELPYTLPQDFTLFIILREKGIDIWKKKLDWIAQKGGMALVNIHPDYINFNGNIRRKEEYPQRLIQEFIEYVKSRYEHDCWFATTQDIAEFWKKTYPFSLKNSVAVSPLKKENIMPAALKQKKKTIWIDLDNTPHVVFFKPIIKELESRGYHIVVSARDCFQVCGLADLMKVNYTRIGKHYGKHKLLKGAGLIIRALQLIPFAMKAKPSLTLSHGSRSQLFLSKLLGLKSILIFDYEHAKTLWIQSPTWHFAPKVVVDELKGTENSGYYSYPGIKEDVYVPDFVPDLAIREQLGVLNDEIMITVRPPATEAHYHNPEAEMLLQSAINLLVSNNKTRVIMVPRNDKQKNDLMHEYPELFAKKKLIVPPKVVDGLNLLWNSDLVISGGGTMNREAAALGVPVYSIFRGPLGSVDKYLEKENRLVMLRSPADVEQKLKIKSRSRSLDSNESRDRKAITTIVENIITLYENKCKK